jgi:hypothetical protein
MSRRMKYDYVSRNGRLQEIVEKMLEWRRREEIRPGSE